MMIFRLYRTDSSQLRPVHPSSSAHVYIYIFNDDGYGDRQWPLGQWAWHGLTASRSQAEPCERLTARTARSSPAVGPDSGATLITVNRRVSVEGTRAPRESRSAPSPSPGNPRDRSVGQVCTVQTLMTRALRARIIDPYNNGNIN